MKQDIVSNFWEKWFNADMLDRQKMVENMMIARKPIEMEEKMRREFVAQVMNSYFEDLENFLMIKYEKGVGT